MKWTQDDLDALCEIVDAQSDLIERIIKDRRRGHEATAESVRERAKALRERTLS